jgi:hypothetical protein
VHWSTLWAPVDSAVERPIPQGGQGPLDFPPEQAAMKCLYLVTRSLDSKGTGQTRWAVRQKTALNAFAITFADRMPAGRVPITMKTPFTPLAGQTHKKSTLRSATTICIARPGVLNDK